MDCMEFRWAEVGRGWLGLDLAGLHCLGSDWIEQAWMGWNHLWMDYFGTE